MKKIFTVLTLMTLTLVGFAQKSTRITGQVIDGSQKTIEAATISLIRSKDSNAVKYAVADKKGIYVFENVPTGQYMVAISAVGHNKGYSEIFEVTEGKSEISVKTIELIPTAKSMGAVTVTAKRPLIEQKIDRTVVNVEASVTNVGSSALEVLEKSPGISVDKDGNISLKGKAGVMVLVDGRPTQLSGTDLANMLRSMNANQMDQIEIMTNPPAKYDAAGNAGIINIKTKKNKQFGYNGSVTANYGQGKYPKFNESMNFNYRKNKLNLFMNAGYNFRERFNNLDIQRNFLEKDSKVILSHFDQQARMKNKSQSFNAKIGADYFAGKNTTIGIVFNGFSNPGKFENRNLTNIYNSNGQLQNQTKALSLQDESWKNFSSNLNFRHVLDTTGKEITADLDYVSYIASTKQSLSNYYFDSEGNSIRKADTLYGYLPQDIRIYSGRVDYLQPLKKGARFEAGLKTSIVRTLNNAIYDTTHNGEIVNDKARTNDFDYEENINAAYVNFSTPLSKKINAQFGLRVENTSSKGHSTGFVFDRMMNDFVSFDTSFSQNYTQLFPTAFIQYKADDKNNFGLNYGRRIRRPNYESLNPFIEYLDRYTYQQGNPNLKPQFSHNIELSHTYKNFLTTTLNYTRTNDIIQQVIEQNEATNETYVKQANIANQRQYGVAVSANMPVTKWWTNSIYVNVFNNSFEGVINTHRVSINATSLQLNGTQQFKLNKTLTGEISGYFRSGGIEGIFQTKPMGQVSVGFTQQIMKGNGSLRLNVRDIFYTQRFQASSKYGNVDAAFQEQGDSRVVNVGFTYRFNKGKMNNNPKRRGSSANDEQNRVGVGN